MAISTDAAIHFFGTQDTLGTTTSAITDGAFSDGTNDLISWTNDDDALFASVTLLVDYTTAPDVGSSISLFAAMQNVVSTNDDEIPDTNFVNTFLGYFPVNDVTTAQYITIDIALPNNQTSSVYNFYIFNDTGQTIPAGWDLYITPKTVGPHA